MADERFEIRMLAKHTGDILHDMEFFGDDIEIFKEHRRFQSYSTVSIDNCGELIELLGEEFTSAHPEIDWARFMDIATKIHDLTFGLKIEDIWDVMHKEVPAINRLCNDLMSVHQ